MGALNWPVFLSRLYSAGVTLTPDCDLEAVEGRPNNAGCRLVLRNAYSGVAEERLVDTLVVEHGTLPNDDLYEVLKPDSKNWGELDLGALIAYRAQARVRIAEGSYFLYRAGDAWACRNVHAAMLDSARIWQRL